MKFLLTFLIFNLFESYLFGQIALDAINDNSYILSPSGNGKSIAGMIGLDQTWRVEENITFAIKSQTSEVSKKDPFFKFTKITETMPLGAKKDPTKRKWNLPDLINQLELEGKLPDSIEKFNTSDTGMTIIIKKPTLISASVSAYRNITIINKSHLILMCPLCQTVTIENSEDKNTVEIYSLICQKVPEIGMTKRIRIGAWVKPCSESVKASAFELKYAEYFPQSLISLTLGRSPLQVMEMWNGLFKISI